jgi:UDP-glucose 4-epimerase
MPKVVITGVAGFLGSHLADKFLAEGYEVVGVDNLLGGYVSNVPDGVDFYVADLSSSVTDIQKYFDGADLVIHAACTAYEGLSVFSPSLINMNTSQATVNCVVASINAGAKKFVYLSSMARYGDQGKMCEETDTPKPQDPYGISKLAAEKFVENLCDVHGVDWLVLVPHNIIGARQKYDDPFRNVASIMINRMLQGKQPIIYGDGQQQRCFSFVTDVINPLYQATVRESAVKKIYNIGPDEETVTINQLAETLADLLDFDLDPIYVTGRPQEVKVALLSAEKARRELDYQTTTSLRDGLSEMIAWIRQAGVKDFDYNLPLEIDSPLVPKTWSNRLM